MRPKERDILSWRNGSGLIGLKADVSPGRDTGRVDGARKTDDLQPRSQLWVSRMSQRFYQRPDENPPGGTRVRPPPDAFAAGDESVDLSPMLELELDVPFCTAAGPLFCDSA